MPVTIRIFEPAIARSRCSTLLRTGPRRGRERSAAAHALHRDFITRR